MKKILLLLSVFALVAFSACKKEKLKKKDYEKEGEKKWNKDDKELCFELVYPLTYTMPDETTITGEDEKLVWEAIKGWYEANPDSKEKPALQYPVTIVLEDETMQPIANEEEMILAKENCYEEDDE